jgi:hypothetical protein
VNRERLLWAFLALALLAGGWLVARAYALQTQPSPEPPVDGFRAWFWSHRALDLAAQIGLILAGALGVAAILPDPREEDDDPWPPST